MPLATSLTPCPPSPPPNMQHLPPPPPHTHNRTQLAPTNDLDDDLVQLSGTTLSLKCPLSGRRVRTPVRFEGPQQPLEVFDLDCFMEVVQRTRKWQVRAGRLGFGGSEGTAGVWDAPSGWGSSASKRVGGRLGCANEKYSCLDPTFLPPAQTNSTLFVTHQFPRCWNYQCPLTQSLMPISSLRRDPYAAAIIDALEAACVDPDTCSEVELSPDGRWRPKGSPAFVTWFDVVARPGVTEVTMAVVAAAMTVEGLGGGVQRKRQRGAKAEGGFGVEGERAGFDQQKQQDRKQVAAAAGAAAAGAAAAGVCVDLTADVAERANLDRLFDKYFPPSAAKEQRGWGWGRGGGRWQQREAARIFVCQCI